MSKSIKFGFIIITFCIVFIVGIFAGKIFFVKGSIDDSKQQSELISAGKTKILTNKDEEFLQDHVYGQWRITQRLVKLNESTQDGLYDTKFNFSDQGVEVLKTIVFRYQEDLINAEVYPSQGSFKNITDLYLFGLYGGFGMLNHPIYHVSYTDTNDITIYNEYMIGYDDTKVANIFKSEKAYKIYADTGVDQNADPVIRTRSFGDTLYADPKDTNTLYLDFCGLWEMKRDSANYRTNGKDTDGKG